MLSAMLYNKKMDLNLFLRNCRNSAEANAVFLKVANTSTLKPKYINKKEIIKDIIMF